MKIKYLVMLALALLLCCPVVLAAQPPEEEDYIIRLKPGVEAEALADFEAETIFEPEGLYRTDDLALVRELEAQGVLEAWEEDQTVTLLGYDEDLALLKSELWSRAILGADYAGENGVTGQGVRVGVIDSGAAMIPALTRCMVEDPEHGGYLGYNYLDGNRNFTDSYGHGTFVASVVASTEVGLAPDIELVPLKCFGGKTTKISIILEAIYGAADVYNCKVINMSFGICVENIESPREFQAAVDYAFAKGIVLVAACGNYSPANKWNELMYPAAYDNVIGVGSVDSGKQVAYHSKKNDSVWVTAPGQDVKGLTLSGKTKDDSGTSYAAPMVTAAAALALSADRSLTPEGFLTLLAETAEDLGPPGRDNAYGYGLLNLGLLLAKLTGDSESVIPSCYSDTLCLSSWQPGAEGQVTWMARYEESGRFFSLEALTGSLNNAPLTADVPLVKLMTVKEDVFAPVRPAAAYGFDTPAE